MVILGCYICFPLHPCVRVGQCGHGTDHDTEVAVDTVIIELKRYFVQVYCIYRTGAHAGPAVHALAEIDYHAAVIPDRILKGCEVTLLFLPFLLGWCRPANLIYYKTLTFLLSIRSEMMNWNEVIQKSRVTGVSPALILREEIQRAALASLSRMGAFNHIVFQGGTALRIFYNNPRFSEDLDFVRVEGESFDLTSRSGEIEVFLSSEFHYLREIRVNVQKNTADIQRMVIKCPSEIPSRRLSINIELFSVPSYRNSPKILAYAPFNPVVRVEEGEEILADKIIAIALREYLKGRDIWDLYYLTTELGVSTSRELLEKKAEDYGVSNMGQRVKEGRERLLDGGVEALDREMKRFLSPGAYDQIRSSFVAIVASVSEALSGYSEEGA